MCVIKPTSLGGSVVCAVCDDDCECVVCLPYDQQEESASEFNKGYSAALWSTRMVEVIPEPASEFELGWNAYALETE